MAEPQAAVADAGGEVTPGAPGAPAARTASAGPGARVWRFLASTELAIWLLLAVGAALAVGSQLVKRDPAFDGLNFLRFQEWLAVRGAASSWWLWILFGLLGLFALNTAACTTERLAFLLRRRREVRSRAFAVSVAPSIMHLLFLVVIGGHALSQFTATVRRMPAEAGARLALSPQVVEVEGSGCTLRSEPGLTALFRGCSARVALSSPGGKAEVRTVELLRPVAWGGYAFHLKMKGMKALTEPPALELVVKKDPGLSLIFLGNAALCLLMLWYFPIIIRKRNGDRTCTKS